MDFFHIGTSGWHYKHWAGNFYPENIREKDQLDYYQHHFDTVELNNPFYRLPNRRHLKNGRSRSRRISFSR